MQRRKHSTGFLLYVVFVSLLPFVVFETAVDYFLKNPSSLKHLPWTVSRIVWTVSRQDWQAIQFHRGCGRYDAELFYTLRPGRSEFSRYGFFRHTRYEVNGKGLRDDEDSLNQPAVIVLGDSYAMGWGVEQEETFAQRLERATGLKTLNAGISSYGTVREIKLLDRLDTSAMRYLIIQYQPNDLEENKTFFEKGFLPVSAEKTYEDTCRKQERMSGYFPGKYTSLIAHFLIRELKKKLKPAPARTPSDVDYFLNALAFAGKTDLRRAKVFVIAKKPFCDELGQKIVTPSFPAFIRRIQPLDITSRITPAMEIPIDYHWNAHGHGFVAEELVKVLS